MNKFIIPATWREQGNFEVEAEILEDALAQVLTLPHPASTYVNNSLSIDLDHITIVKPVEEE